MYLQKKKSKCRFGVSHVDYLGNTISDQRVVVDPTKVQAILEWPIPKTRREVRCFLDLASCY